MSKLRLPVLYIWFPFPWAWPLPKDVSDVRLTVCDPSENSVTQIVTSHQKTLNVTPAADRLEDGISLCEEDFLRTVEQD